ncbi:MAG TPA: hypothetical protein PLQ13_04880 [Candidatus Krumholzibacteria bacterium]|nr:hypothetical protein [Candidatus Krumholzibacteria bacterium]
MHDQGTLNTGNTPSIGQDSRTRALLRLVADSGRPEPLARALARHLAAQQHADALAAELRVLADTARGRDQAGALLVEAMLCTAPAGHRQLGVVRGFRSAARLAGSPLPGERASAAPDWRATLSGLLPPARGAALAATLRARCDGHLTRLLKGEEPGPAARGELRALLALEIDARAERIGALAVRLASRGGPEAARRLRRLSFMDAELDDLRDLAERLGDRGGRADILGVRSRFLSALGADAACRIDAAVAVAPGLERLALVWRGLAAPTPAVADPGAAWRRLRAVAALPDAGLLLPQEPDPLALATLVMAGGDGAAVRVPLGAAARQRLVTGPAWRLPEGVTIADGVLEVAADDACRAVALAAPVPAAVQAPAEPQEEENLGQAELKRLVLTSLQSTSATIAFLRDAKITSIPGLVQEIVVRTRNPQILEIIAATRPLHSGFANRGVPLAMLKSPVNIPVKSIRKFIHVKYISKVELKRMAADRTGIRREVGQEIEHYLSSLA